MPKAKGQPADTSDQPPAVTSAALRQWMRGIELRLGRIERDHQKESA